jgi:hypothetical protein
VRAPVVATPFVSQSETTKVGTPIDNRRLSIYRFCAKILSDDAIVPGSISIGIVTFYPIIAFPHTH